MFDTIAATGFARVAYAAQDMAVKEGQARGRAVCSIASPKE